MPNEHSAVINASPVVALAAALDDFSILAQVVSRLIVPSEVIAELHAGSDRDAAADLIKSERRSKRRDAHLEFSR